MRTPPIWIRISRVAEHSLALGLVVCALLVGCFPGRRLLKGTIEKDGVVLVETMFDVPDSATELEAVEAATAQTWKARAGGPEIPRGELGPGAVFRLIHGSSPFVELPCEAMKLLRSADGSGWRTNPQLILEPNL